MAYKRRERKMTDSARYQLLDTAIEHLEGEYIDRPSACIALLIARYYRLLADNPGANKQINRAHANFWFECYLQHRGCAKKMRSYLKDQFSYGEVLQAF